MNSKLFCESLSVIHYKRIAKRQYIPKARILPTCKWNYKAKKSQSYTN